MAMGAIGALSSVNYSPWPIIVGFDGIPEAREAIRNGKMHATVAQNPALMGEKAIDVFVELRQGKKFDAPVTIFPTLLTAQSLH